MPSRRAQRRNGTRKSRQLGDPLRAYLRAEYDEVLRAWLADRSPFRPAVPPAPPLSYQPRNERTPDTDAGGSPGPLLEGGTQPGNQPGSTADTLAEGAPR